MTWTDFENTLTVEAGGICRRFLLKARQFTSQVDITSAVCHRTRGISNGLLTAACQRDGHEVSSLFKTSQEQVVYVVPVKRC